MMAKPIRALELHYPLIQFIIIKIIGAISMKGYFSKGNTTCKTWFLLVGKVHMKRA